MERRVVWTRLGGARCRSDSCDPAGGAREDSLATQIVDAMNKVYGAHPGFRANHAKGTVVEGASGLRPEAAKWTVFSDLREREDPGHRAVLGCGRDPERLGRSPVPIRMGWP